MAPRGLCYVLWYVLSWCSLWHIQHACACEFGMKCVCAIASHKSRRSQARDNQQQQTNCVRELVPETVCARLSIRCTESLREHINNIEAATASSFPTWPDDARVWRLQGDKFVAAINSLLEWWCCLLSYCFARNSDRSWRSSSNYYWSSISVGFRWWPANYDLF